MEKFLSLTHRHRTLWQARIDRGPSSRPPCKLDSPQLFICTLPLSDDKQQRQYSAIRMYTQLPRWFPTVLFGVTPPSLVDASKNTSLFTRLSILIPPIPSLVDVMFYCRITVRRYVSMWFHGPRQPRHVYCELSVYPPSFNSFALHRRHLTPRKTRCLLKPVHFGLGGRSLFFRSGCGVFTQSWSETNNIRALRGRESWPPPGGPPRSGLFIKDLPCGVGRTLHVAWVALAYAPQLSDRRRSEECPQRHCPDHPVKSSRKCWHAVLERNLSKLCRPTSTHSSADYYLRGSHQSIRNLIDLALSPFFHRPIRQIPCHRSCYPSYLSAPTYRLR